MLITVGCAGNQWRQAEKDGGAAPRYEEIVGIRWGRAEERAVGGGLVVGH